MEVLYCQKLKASMGPRLINRGNIGGGVAFRTEPKGFNGAAVDQPRKSHIATLQRRDCRELQWGRG